ncbi:molybdenum cofactor guanylyltransferase [Bacteroidota bacterium]
MKTTGIILAGGQGRRMGMEKGLTQFLGKPLIEHVIDAIKPLCDDITISANSSSYDYLGISVINDVLQDTGPSAGIHACLESSLNYINIIVPCDMPLVSASFFRCLLAYSEDYDITVTEVEERIQPLCGIYKKSISHRLGKLLESGEKRMTSLLDRFNTNYVGESDFPEHNLETILLNFNSPEEIAKYLKNNDE